MLQAKGRGGDSQGRDYEPATSSDQRSSIRRALKLVKAAPAETASSATSDAVSKPRPKRNPIGYMCQLVETTLKRRPKILVISPPATSSCCSEPRSYSPRRIRR